MSATINDLASFNKFFTENQHRFIRFAWTYTRDEVVAEDIVMESLMAYWENRDHMTPEINPAAYVLTVVKNKCLKCNIFVVYLGKNIFLEYFFHNQWHAGYDARADFCK